MNYAQDNPYLYKEFREWKRKKQKTQFPYRFAYTPCNLGARFSKIKLKGYP